MPNSDWVITKAKKISPNAGISSRRRLPKASPLRSPANAPFRDPPALKMQQQTLTQLQWTPSPKNEADFNSTGKEDERYARKKTPRSKIPKRSTSTLTQMDFFKTPLSDPFDFGDEILEVPGSKSTSSTIAQLDGSDEHPTRGTKRGSAARNVLETRSSAKRRRLEVGLDDFEHSTRTRSKNPAISRTSDQGQSGSLRRSSRRSGLTTSITSEMCQKHAGTATPTLTTSMSSFDQNLSPSKKPRLHNDPMSSAPTSVTSTSYRNLLTPQKTRYVVPSSQSPEDLSPSSTRKSKRSLSRMLSPFRQPLRERSANLSFDPGRRNTKTPRKQQQHRLSTVPEPGGMRSNAAGEIMKNTPNNDTTISDRKFYGRGKLSLDDHMRQSQEASHIQVTEVLEIPSSSGLEMEETENQPELPTMQQNNGTYQSLASRNDPGDEDISLRSPRLSECPIMQPPHIIKKSNQVNHPLGSHNIPQPLVRQNTVQDSEDGLGSPIRNDTQFEDLLARFTSPACTPSHERVDLLPAANVVSPVLTGRYHREGMAANEKDYLISSPHQMEPPLPHVSSLAREISSLFGVSSEEKDESNKPKFLHASEPDALPPPKVVRKSTRMVRLKDNPTSSSPSSEASTVSAKSRPASMPRPSQLSTQAPTQGFLLGSSPKTSIGMIHEGPETYTVKDSSSSFTRLSQISPYVADSEDSDLDLDYKPQIQQNFRRKKIQDAVPENLDLTPTLTRGVRETDPPRSDLTQSLRSPQEPLHHVPVAASLPNEPDKNEPPPSSIATSEFMSSSPPLPPLQRDYSPLEGFDNDTQSNFTQNGHITAAYVHRQRETGIWPDWFNPRPFQVTNYKRPEKRKKRRSGKRRQLTAENDCGGDGSKV